PSNRHDTAVVTSLLGLLIVVQSHRLPDRDKDDGRIPVIVEIGLPSIVKASFGGLQRVVTTFALCWKESVCSELMATAPGSGIAVREELERVLSSNCFARSERVSKLLRYLVERQLEGSENELKESIIGVEVFGRAPDYNPKVDSTVRTEAARLRARLSR